jgi:1-acyl-sn-glycerol-3-phosphate acyltransferase
VTTLSGDRLRDGVGGPLPPFHWWRTIFFLIPCVSLFTVALGTVSFCASFFETNGRLAHGCAQLWSRLILLTTGVRVRVVGIERLDPRGPYIFIANHQSLYDIPIVFVSLPHQVRIIAKQSLGRIPFVGWHLHRTGHVLVDRTHPERSILSRWKALLTSGLSLIVFPEGTRSIDGRVGRFKAGSFLLAIQAHVPIVPLSIVGSLDVMKKGRLRVEPGEVTLVVHPPMTTSSDEFPPTVAGARVLAERVRQMVSDGVVKHPEELRN